MSLMTPSEHWEGYDPTEELENFRNNGGSAGLDGVSGVGKENVLEDKGWRVYYEILKGICGEPFLKAVYHNEVGNPVGFKYDGRWITRSDIQNTFNAWRLSQFLEDGLHITEIGPGFGGLVAMLRRLYPGMTFDLIDLPDQRRIQHYYLSETVGTEGINWIEPDEARKSDVVVNIRSMMEMENTQIREYFRLIHGVIEPDLFYCVNRYAKRKTRLKDYPFGDEWTIKVSRTLIFETTIHEFLLKRGGEGFEKQLEGMPPYWLDYQGEHIELHPAFTLDNYERIG